MAPVVRIEPNGSQALLLFDDARKDLEDSGWLGVYTEVRGFQSFCCTTIRPYL
jgi:hypothetical protein